MEGQTHSDALSDKSVCEGVQSEAKLSVGLLQPSSGVSQRNLVTSRNKKATHQSQSLRFLGAKTQGGLEHKFAQPSQRVVFGWVTKNTFCSHTWAVEQLDAFGLLKSHFMPRVLEEKSTFWPLGGGFEVRIWIGISIASALVSVRRPPWHSGDPLTEGQSNLRKFQPRSTPTVKTKVKTARFLCCYITRL